MIEDDTAAHYLPPRDTEHRGRGGATGHWEPWMERRAELLYRLRDLNRRTGVGPVGDVLRLFLFRADGWGWEYVRNTCIQGYRVAVRAAKQGTKNRLRGKPLTLESILAVGEDIAAEQYKPKEPNQGQIDRVKMTLGLVVLGAAPDNKIGTMERITNDLMPDADPEAMALHRQYAQIGFTMLAATESEAIEILESKVTDELIRRALQMSRRFLWRVRALLRRITRPHVEGKQPPLNPLSFFGASTDPGFRQALRNMPIRARPAEFLGGQFAHSLVMAYKEEQLGKAAEFYVRWLPFFLQSDACTQWLAQVEREIKKRKN
ncbi:MAG: hypothetical protein WAK16_02945 [Candidatus Cybelea sp.]